MCPCYCYMYKMFHCLGKLPILTSKYVSPLTRGKVFRACIRPALLHGSETWAPTAPDLQRLCRNDRAMIRWICSVKPHEEVPMETLYTKLGIHEVAVALRTKRLKWYGHVPCASSWAYSITSIAIPGPRGGGRPRKSWSECLSGCQCVQPRRHQSPEQRSLEIWCEKHKPTAAYPRNWKTICSLNIKPGLSK